MADAAWCFEVDGEELVTLSVTPEIPQNAVLALETLILPFGLSWRSASTYLCEWRRMARELSEGYTLGTSAAAVERLDGELVKIRDMYGQFDDCLMSNVGFEKCMEGLIEYLQEVEVNGLAGSTGCGRVLQAADSVRGRGRGDRAG